MSKQTDLHILLRELREENKRLKKILNIPCASTDKDKIEQIIELTSLFFGLNITDKTRKREVVEARQMAMYYCVRSTLSVSLSEIGLYFGGYDHSTVIHARETISNLTLKYQKIRNKYENFKKFIDEKTRVQNSAHESNHNATSSF